MKNIIDLNAEFLRALQLMEEPEGHCLITGRAGTGKSTLLKHFRETTKRKVVVLAPTGVAAVNVQGQTLHSFFRFRPDVTPETAVREAKRMAKWDGAKIYRKIETIIVDEISMIRADILDCADLFLQHVRGRQGESFGGVKMIFIGDLYQLPPVVRSTEKHIFEELYPGIYFFDSNVFRQTSFERIELEKVYRQKDAKFVRLLNAVRNNSLTEADLKNFNRRYLPDFKMGEELSITLTAMNEPARNINALKLKSLKEKSRFYNGETSGDFGNESFPTETRLELKPKAQVMLLNNDSLGRWINGTMATVVSLHKDHVQVRLENGEEEIVEPNTWNLFRYAYDKKKKRLTSETTGSFTQIPLKLAWAVTIHKSQGKTFDHVVVDVGRGTFATGQMYVALSRCTSLEGLVLHQRLTKQQVRVDYRIVRFLTGEAYEVSEKKLPLKKKMALIQEAIDDERIMDVVYLKANDEKSQRKLRPIEMGEMEYSGKIFLGFRAFCETRKEERHFRVDRILELKLV
ncbi:MAG: AAA family ATPase [Deltaproteobacteria bacterium]|nr:AAA family ATPase [Deltaproteobacteria bacterium]